MNLVKIAIVKQLFHTGVLERAVISEAPMSKGYIVHFMMKETAYILSNDKGSERVFKTIETARKAIKDVGFKDMSLL